MLVGDILEKGPDSLGLLRDILELSQDHTILPVCGNCDGLVLRFFEDDLWDQGFFRVYLPAHPESILRQMAREAGFDRWDDLPRLRECLRRTFPWVWDWLRSLPTILESEHLVFVHGGVPSLDRMEELDAWHCMKNDDYWGQDHSFAHTGKYVVVGHWPVTLYDPPASPPLPPSSTAHGTSSPSTAAASSSWTVSSTPLSSRRSPLRTSAGPPTTGCPRPGPWTHRRLRRIP